jgi:branched-chain amino acid transport system permease protein
MPGWFNVTLVIGAIASGALYALIAISLILIFQATGIINFGQGEALMVGAYAYVLVAGLGANPLVQLASAILAGILTGLAFFVVTHVFMARANETTVLMGTLAISLLLQAGARLIFTDYPKPAQPWLFGDVNLHLGGATVSVNSATTLAATIVITGGLYLWFTKTALGKAMRAVAEDARSAALSGISVGAMLALSWTISGAVTAVAGVLLSPVTGVFPAMGGPILFPTFIAAALGGFESISGALFGGLILGVLQTYAVVYVGGAFRDFITFALLLAILMLRPKGVFAAVQRRVH